MLSNIKILVVFSMPKYQKNSVTRLVGSTISAANHMKRIESTKIQIENGEFAMTARENLK
jgi:hypothetical protein